MHPALDILRCFFDISFPIMTRALRVGVGLCSMCALAHESLLVVIEEVGGFEGLRDKEDATGCPYYGDDTLDHV